MPSIVQRLIIGGANNQQNKLEYAKFEKSLHKLFYLLTASFKPTLLSMEIHNGKFSFSFHVYNCFCINCYRFRGQIYGIYNVHFLKDPSIEFFYTASRVQYQLIKHKSLH